MRVGLRVGEGDNVRIRHTHTQWTEQFPTCVPIFIHDMVVSDRNLPVLIRFQSFSNDHYNQVAYHQVANPKHWLSESTKWQCC
jgi:hypothetical protein